LDRRISHGFLYALHGAKAALLILDDAGLNCRELVNDGGAEGWARCRLRISSSSADNAPAE